MQGGISHQLLMGFFFFYSVSVSLLFPLSLLPLPVCTELLVDINSNCDANSFWYDSLFSCMIKKNKKESNTAAPVTSVCLRPTDFFNSETFKTQSWRQKTQRGRRVVYLCERCVYSQAQAELGVGETPRQGGLLGCLLRGRKFTTHSSATPPTLEVSPPPHLSSYLTPQTAPINAHIAQQNLIDGLADKKTRKQLLSHFLSFVSYLYLGL